MLPVNSESEMDIFGHVRIASAQVGLSVVALDVGVIEGSKVGSNVRTIVQQPCLQINH